MTLVPVDTGKDNPSYHSIHLYVSFWLTVDASESELCLKIKIFIRDI